MTLTIIGLALILAIIFMMAAFAAMEVRRDEDDVWEYYTRNKKRYWRKKQ